MIGLRVTPNDFYFYKPYLVELVWQRWKYSCKISLKTKMKIVIIIFLHKNIIHFYLKKKLSVIVYFRAYSLYSHICYTPRPNSLNVQKTCSQSVVVITFWPITEKCLYFAF